MLHGIPQLPSPTSSMDPHPDAKTVGGSLGGGTALGTALFTPCRGVQPPPCPGFTKPGSIPLPAKTGALLLADRSIFRPEETITIIGLYLLATQL